ncbi:MAG TPA: hypothetical protein PLY93_09100 [Turneriella sp.]|nr:hypothetical protein [Turneriella sp.]
MPEDAREMIEFVYGDAQDIPAALKDWSDAAEQKENKKESMAVRNMVNFSQGYTATNDADWDDVSAPSRYSEQKSVKIVLARLRDGVCEPWHKAGDSRHSWAASEVSLPDYIAAAEDHVDEATSTAVACSRETLPSRGKYAIFVVLSKNDNGYFGFAVNSKGQRNKLLYNRKTGLEKESA